MPPRPFPQSLSIGTDICHYTRFLKYFPTHQNTTPAISSQTLLFKLFDKTFLPSEQRDFWRKFQAPSVTQRRFVPGSGSVAISPQVHQWDEQRAQEAARHIGGRWAAKEAVIKAFSSQRRLMLRDVEIRRDAKTKQPLAVVLDETSNTKHQSAKEVYGNLIRRWKLRERLENLQREGAGGGVTPGKGLRIIKEPSLNRHTARSLEFKEGLPQHEPTSEPETRTPAPASASTPSILSEQGILDLSAVTQLLDQEQPSSSAPPTQELQEAQQQNQDTRNPQENPEEQQSKRSQLEEEMKRLRKEEQAEDAWNNLQGQIVKVSISHDGEYCVATALAAV
ncbi:hypothetical protein KCU83_g2145, partial [Aureobasidium melanogenum]